MKQKIINYLLKYLLCSVNPNDIIYTVYPQKATKEKPAGVYLGGQLITDIEVKTLKEEAISLEHMRLWKVINETIRADAMETGFKKSVNFDDLKTCKLMLYNLDIINSVIKIIKNK